MSPLFVIPSRYPFASAALPAFIATTGTSDSQSPPPSSSLFRLVGGGACSFPAPTLGSPWLLCSGYVKLDTAQRSRVGSDTTRQGVVATVVCWRLEAIGPFQGGHFGTPLPSRPAISRSIAPRLLSRLRIKRAVTATPARLDTWPVASGYQGGSSTRQATQHCHAATET